jgi:putative ABC transport system ATP-binding protein/lipoprotein-releasing system ATP-binding protein
MVLIKTDNLSKIYRVRGAEIRAVDDISLEIGEGEFVSIVGRSGAGKTTLLSIIGGLTRPSSGRVYVGDEDILGLSNSELSRFRNEKIGFIYQFASLIPTLTSLENVLLPSIFGGGRGDLRARAIGLLDLVGLSEKADNYPSQLSGGEQRRVAITRALINSPEIILADEPTGDLDEETETEIISLFKRLKDEEGITLVMVTHSRALARHSQRILTMSKGKIVREEFMEDEILLRR